MTVLVWSTLEGTLVGLRAEVRPRLLVAHRWCPTMGTVTMATVMAVVVLADQALPVLTAPQKGGCDHLPSMVVSWHIRGRRLVRWMVVVMLAVVLRCRKIVDERTHPCLDRC